MKLSEFVTLIRGYTGRQDSSALTDDLIVSWVRQAEERISSSLRNADMVQIDTATVSVSRVQLPPDWREADYVRVLGVGSLEYRSRTDFYNHSDDGPAGYFTTSGFYLMIGGQPNTVEGKTVELHYFGDVPRLVEEDESSWVAEKHQSLLIPATMIYASERLLDGDIDWESKFDTRINELNTEYLKAKSSGSRLARKGRSFG